MLFYASEKYPTEGSYSKYISEVFFISPISFLNYNYNYFSISMFFLVVIYFHIIIYDQHGGSDNAYTDTENTNYHFDVNADCFEEALDRY